MRAVRIAGLAVVGLSIMVLPPFLAAGRLDWAGGWIWLATTFIGLAFVRVYVGRRNPGLPRRRSRIGEGTPGWDIAAVNVLRLTIIAVLIVGGLDGGRFRWSPLPVWSQVAGVLLMSAGLAVAGLAMGANVHFEATVRIQDDVGHAVIDQGPYRFVRHPGYAGIIVMIAGTALVLGSGWALLPAAAGIITVVVRTVLEDRFLCERLNGYREYASRVRYRLVPALW